MTNPKAHRITIVASALAVALSVPALAGTIDLRWNPVPEATGYRVYYGTAAGEYVSSVNIGPGTSGTLSGLQDCREIFLAVKAYNGAGESSEFSNEVRGWARPEVSSHGPLVAIQGSTMTVDIFGDNFQTGAELVFDAGSVPSYPEGRPLVVLDSVTVLSCHQIQALMTVEPLARGLRAMEVGQFNLEFEVRNPDSVFGSGPITLRVDLDPTRLDVNRSDSRTRDRVDGKDLVWLAHAHGTEQGDARFSADADINGDGMVDGEDLAYLATGFGACWTGSGWSATACD
jgi:hypothetical protein